MLKTNPINKLANFFREWNILYFFRSTTKNRRINLIEKNKVDSDSSKKGKLSEFCLWEIVRNISTSLEMPWRLKMMIDSFNPVFILLWAQHKVNLFLEFIDNIIIYAQLHLWILTITVSLIIFKYNSAWKITNQISL